MRQAYFRNWLSSGLVVLTLLLGSYMTFGSPSVASATPGQQELPVIPAAGNVYYVSPSGDDANPGTIGAPFRTLQTALQRLVPGDTLYVRGGTYPVPNTADQIRFYNSGQSHSHISVLAYPGEQPIIEGAYPGQDASVHYGIVVNGHSYIRIEGLTIRGFRGGIACRAPGHHVLIRNNTVEYNSVVGITSSGASSVSQEGCDYITIERNTVRHNGYYMNGQPATGQGEGWGSGIVLNPQYNQYRFDNDTSRFHSIIRANMVYHNYDGTGGNMDPGPDHEDGNGIIVDLGGDMPPALIENNVVFNNGGRCIHLFGSQNIWIVGNTCYQNAFDPDIPFANTIPEISGYTSREGVPLNNVHIKNNIVFSRPDRYLNAFNELQPGAVAIQNNIWFGGSYGPNSVKGENFVEANPMFVNATTDPATANFHLQAGSPAIDAGNASLFAGSQTNDMGGATRPYGAGYDIGAHEFGAQVQPTVTPTSTPTVAPYPPEAWLPLLLKMR